MKTKTYQYLVVILSLMMILAASCGRREEQGIATSASDMTEAMSDISASVEDPTCTEEAVDVFPYATARFCFADEGQAVVILEDGALLSLSYDTVSGDICNRSGKAVLNISALELGDVLRISYSMEDAAGHPDSTEICDIVKKVDASSKCAESRGCFMVISVDGSTLLVHPRPQEVLDFAKIDPTECYVIDTAGLPIVDEQDITKVLSVSELKPGDFVTVMDTGKRSADKPARLASVFSVTRCAHVTEQRTVTSIYEGADHVLFGDVSLPRSYFDRGDVVDIRGNRVSFEDVSVGDLFEIQHDGNLTASVPAKLGRIYTVRRIKTIEQIKIEQAAQAALDAMNKLYTLRGTVRVFGTGSKLVWFGETSAPEEIDYFACTRVGGPQYTITDAATGQVLTWGDLQDGDYVAVTGSGGIAESAPAQWYGIQSITRLARLCHEGRVSAIDADGVTVALEDGSARRVSVETYYVSGTRFDIAALQVGDRVRLDVNAQDETEVYALHLLDRESQIPDDAVTETFRVSIVSGTRVYMMRDLNCDASYHRFDEQGVAIYDGDVSFDVKRVFYDTDGGVHPAKRIRQGDLITVIHSGVMTEAEPAEFATIYRIIRVTE